MNIIGDDHQRLLNRSIDEDTHIRSARYVRADGIPILIEEWTWEAIHGFTALFLVEHVATMDDAAIKTFLTEQGVDLGSAGVTIRCRDEYVFVNFGFFAN